VLNDAQIASLKQRLKLTAEQERMWPAVEAALRKIVYTKNAMNPQTGAAQSERFPTASSIRAAPGTAAQIRRPPADHAPQ
jgi:hypothetical protein